MSLDTATPAPGGAGNTARQPSPSAVTKADIAKAGATRFGSGWAWLGLANGKLLITSTPNQDNPLMTGLVDTPCEPILGVDVWEHAYYLKYQNRRGDYLSAGWEIVNWTEVELRYAKAM